MSDLISANGLFDRRRLVATLMEDRGDSLVVAGLGAATWDLAAAGDHPGNVYTWGGMGLACMMGFGLALAQPERRVLVVTGDGEMMMGVGSLAAIANAPARNLAILVLDNQAFGETGKQTGLTAGATDIRAMAEGAGIRETMSATKADDLADLKTLLFATAGPTLAVARIELSDDPPRSGRRVRACTGPATSSGGTGTGASPTWGGPTTR
jgi:thiamine pyrophosphate-dependent acetolactate synthase large subunit-like protein